MSDETSESSSFSSLSDAELRQELNRHGISFGPILQSTRKVYEKKLQNVLMGQHNGGHSSENLLNGAMNGGGGEKDGTPLREFRAEISPINFVQQQQNDAVRESSPRLALDEEGSDDDEEPSESARVLTPDEIRTFRSNFTSVLGSSPAVVAANGSPLRQRRVREYSPPFETAKRTIGNKNPNSRTAAGGHQKKSLLKRAIVPLIALTVFGVVLVTTGWLREYIAPIFDNNDDTMDTANSAATDEMV